MSEKRKENWIAIKTPDNKNMIGSPAYVKKLLGLDLSNIFNRLERLERLEGKVERLESPKRQQNIIDTLQGQGKHNSIWLRNRVFYRGYDLSDLVEKGIVIESKSGTQPMLELSQFKEKVDK